MENGANKQVSKTTGGILTGVSTLVFIGVLIIIQLISLKHNQRFDLTSNQRFSLSAQTLSVLTNLDKEIEAFCFYKPDEAEYETVKDLLEQYQNATDKFKYQMVDLDVDPMMAKTYDVSSYATTVLTYDGHHRKAITATEKEFTNTIVKLTHGETKKKFYFLTLHGERDIDNMEAEGLGAIKLALEDSNYEVSNLNLLKESSVPEDADSLVIAGPSQDLNDTEIEAIRSYVTNGGNLMVFVDPEMAPKLGLLLKEFGIEASSGIIVDPKGFKNYLNPIVEEYTEHEITKDFSYGTVFQMARSIGVQEPLPNGITATVLASTSPESWLESVTEDLGKVEPAFDKSKDKQGPLPIAVVAQTGSESKSDPEMQPPDDPKDIEPEKPEKQSKIIVFGDSDFINNIFVSTFPTNAALVMNSFHWIAEEKDLIAIPPKDNKSQPLHLSPSQAAFAFWIPVVILPLTILVAGGIRIYERRRNG